MTNHAPPLSFHHEFAAPRRPAPAPWEPMLRMGPFHGVLTPTELRRPAGCYPTRLFLGMMTKLPRPDGLGGVELQGSDYQRQAVTFVPRDAQHLCVPRPILFEITRCPRLAGVALFDAPTDGQLVAYGALITSRLSVRPGERIEIPSHQLLLKRLG